MFAQIEDGKVVKFPIYNLKQEFPNVSFPKDIHHEVLPEGIVFVHEESVPDFDSTTHKLVRSDLFEKDNKTWGYRYEAVALSKAERDEVAKEIATNVRAQRDSLLSACDWTQSADAPLAVKKVWAAYRQKLRDVTSQKGFPHKIVWPEIPTKK